MSFCNTKHWGHQLLKMLLALSLFLTPKQLFLVFFGILNNDHKYFLPNSQILKRVSFLPTFLIHSVSVNID